MFVVVVAVVSDVVKGLVVDGDVDGEAADGFMKIDVRGSWEEERQWKDDHLTHRPDRLHSVPVNRCRSQHCKHCHQTGKCSLLSPWWR